jgi:hypothetical protein
VRRAVYAAGPHIDEAASRPDELGEPDAFAGEADALFEGGAIRHGIGVVAEVGKRVPKSGYGGQAA